MTEDAQRLAREILTEPLEREGVFWRAPGYAATIENWDALATENEIHAAMSARNETAESNKSKENVDFILTYAKPGMRVLDVGCGYGRLAKYLLPRTTFEAYVGVDSSLVMLNKFQERYASRPEERRTPLILVHGDIDRLPVRDASIDLCIVSAVFLHNHKDITRRSVAEIHRVLKPGGRLLAISSFPNAASLSGLQGRAFLAYLRMKGEERKNGPVRFFSRAEIGNLLTSFDDVKIHPYGFSLYPKTLLGLPKFMRWHYRRSYDVLHAFLKPRLPQAVRDAFCVHYDVMAEKSEGG